MSSFPAPPRAPRRSGAARRIVLAFLAVLPAACGREDPAAPAPIEEPGTVEAVRAAAHPLGGAPSDLDPLIAAIGDARIVLLGESTHGTHEFYRERARITQRLIEEKGFAAVAIEGDWPETSRVNRYVRGLPGAATADAALAGYVRFPTWMWRNEVVRDFVGWLRTRNDARTAADDVGFYGLDVYALGTAIDEVVAYASRVDPVAADALRARYACFTPYAGDAERYGQAISRGDASCAGPAAEALRAAEALPAARAGDAAAAEERFSALRSAHSVVDAEAYYRTAYAGSGSSWNVRDRGMAATLEALSEHVAARSGRAAKLVVWAHNTHVGDARWTAMGQQGGEVNLGQLVRQQHGAQAFTVGFLTYSGKVFAAPEWGAQGRVFDVRPALAGSYSALLHEALGDDHLLILATGPATDALAASRLERAIGVVYAPATERQSHYFTAQLAKQFDALLYIDASTAVRALDD